MSNPTAATPQTGSSTVPAAPAAPAQDLRVRRQEDDSKCWLEAKIRFQDRIRQSKRPPSQDNINDFLNNNVNVSKAISECEILKARADSRYDGPLGKLLSVLNVLKDVGDAVLTCAPETVSIAWGIISLLVGVGVNDMENCGKISEASTNIVTIILNCRLYENRHDSNSKQGLRATELAERVMEAIKELITVILEFFWHANRKLRQDRKLKNFIDIFNFKSTANEKYEAIIVMYKDLRGMAQDEFEDNVLSWLNEIKQENAKLAETLKGENEEVIKKLLLPELHEIKNKLDDIQADVTEVKVDVKVVKGDIEDVKIDMKDIKDGVTNLKDGGIERLREKLLKETFQRYYVDLGPSNAHIQILSMTLGPLKRKAGSSTRHLSRWLFTNENYLSWQDGSLKLLYVKGQAGFGKSATMAVAIERLLETTNEDHFREAHPPYKSVSTAGDGTPSRPGSPESPTSSLKGCPVLYFFFKRGDAGTELTQKAFQSLLAQLAHPKHAWSTEEMTKVIKILARTTNEMHGSAVDGETTIINDKEDPANQQARSKPFPGQKSTKTGIDANLDKLERIARLLGKTVYIVVDGVDESTDQQLAGLMPKLIALGRSTKASFKIMVSSRENMDLEKHFATNEESKKLFTRQITREDSGDLVEGERGGPQKTGLQCIAYGDTAIMTVTKSTNEPDMRAYLEDSLTELLNPLAAQLMKLSGPEYDLGVLDKNISKKQVKEIQRMVDTIQKKAEGMFTYSAMVIASLNQPSPLSIKQRVRQLPDQMDSLYARHLESLTTSQRKLVMLALERVIYSPRDINTFEIIEQFKGEYLEAKDREASGEYDSGEEGEDEDSSDGESDAGLQDSQTPEEFEKGVTRLLDKEEQKPDIVYTTHHLETAGREFFKFGNGRIDAIHKSVRDWVEKEAKKSEQRYARQMAISDIFQRDDSEMFVENIAVSADFKSEKDAHLDTLIYLFEVITNERFMDKYLPLHAYNLVSVYMKGTNDIDRDIDDNENPTTRGRGEISRWPHHMERVAELWPKELRVGKKWDKLRNLLRKFSHPDIFRRWASHAYIIESGLRGVWKSIEVLSSPGLALVIVGNVNIFMDFLLTDKNVSYDFRAEAEACGQSVLHVPVIFWFPDIVERLIVEGRVDISAKDKDGNTPFDICWHTFCSFRLTSEETLKASLNVILKVSPNINLNSLKDELGNELEYSSALDYFIDNGNLELFETLMENQSPNICLDVPDASTGQTILHTIWHSPAPGLRIHRNHEVQVEVARRLLKAGCDPNFQDTNSAGPLQFAVSAMNKRGVELLIEAGANVNDDNTAGQTALHVCVSAETNNGTSHSTLTLAEFERERMAIIYVLKRAGADINIRTKTGKTPLMDALLKDRLEVARALLDMHASEKPGDHSYLLQRDIRERTLLHLAGFQIDHDVSRIIAEMVISRLEPAEITEILDLKENTGFTALRIAWVYDSPKLLAYLIQCHHRYQSGTNSISLQKHIFPTLWTRDLPKEAFEILTSRSEKELSQFILSLQLRKLIVLFLVGDIAEYDVDPFYLDDEGWDAFDWAYQYSRLDVMDDHFPEQWRTVDYTAREMGWRERFKPITGWDSQNTHEMIEISDGGLLTTRIEGYGKDLEEDSRFGASSKYPVPPYQDFFYYEITILDAEPKECSFVAIGLVADGLDVSSMPGWVDNSNITFGFHGDDGLFFTSEDRLGKEPESGAVTFGVGDTVGCAYDQATHEVFWTLNGNRVAGGFNDVRERLFPMISGAGIYSTKANFGTNPGFPFVWKGMEGRM
ncbi:hypothetical protein H072_10262 [Dactylellina haptotyla CBS 200.50]|uniref:B30.2/SPRY domain-containing protein n=1 Tax=Dactylellina haptotyla (strain CBS 200.50) TaxID=1284197 RepID=S8A0J7_DACHA|nr:hypothetical protein H072_10262 [Dactylellina haptotyla CBS 200.50]